MKARTEAEWRAMGIPRAYRSLTGIVAWEKLWDQAILENERRTIRPMINELASTLTNDELVDLIEGLATDLYFYGEENCGRIGPYTFFEYSTKNVIHELQAVLRDRS